MSRKTNCIHLKVSTILELPTITVLLFISGRREVRYSELAKRIRSRGTLALVLRELDEEGLLVRRVVARKPIESYYSLTQKGARVATAMLEVERSLANRPV